MVERHHLTFIGPGTAILQDVQIVSSLLTHLANRVFQVFQPFHLFHPFQNNRENIMKFKVIPISSEVSAQARQNLIFPQYQSLKAFVDIATGYGPCRSCLKTFSQGEDKRLFFTYNAFEGLADLPDPGPVFIHNDRCSEFAADEFPPDLRDLPLLFEAYDETGEMITRERAGVSIEKQVEEILALPLVEFVHIRNHEAGCFIARIEPR